MGDCKYCENVAHEGELCATCRSRLGLVAGPAVRRALPCQRCNHPQLVRALARELTSSPGEYGGRELFPMAVSLVPKPKTGFFSGAPKGVDEGHFERLVGVLEMYVCRQCGFTEWYCRDPQRLPIGEEFGTELIDITPDAPYR